MWIILIHNQWVNNNDLFVNQAPTIGHLIQFFSNLKKVSFIPLIKDQSLEALRYLLYFIWTLTLIIVNCVKDYEIYIHILNCISDLVRFKFMILTLNNNTCRLSYKANNMPVALATLGTRASAGMALTPKSVLLCLHHEKIRKAYNEPYPVGGLINNCAPII